MDELRMTLTEAEWAVMECLWEKPRTGREAAQWLSDNKGWSRSTSLTLIRRLEAKGAVADDTVDGVKCFRPLISRDDAAIRETEDFLHRVYNGSISMMVSSLTKKQALSQKEIDELSDILREMEAKSDD